MLQAKVQTENSAEHDHAQGDDDTAKRMEESLGSVVNGSDCRDSPTGWYDSDGSTYNCKWYGQSTRCSDFGHQYARLGKVANQACCACGGGITTKTTTPSGAFEKWSNDNHEGVDISHRCSGRDHAVALKFKEQGGYGLVDLSLGCGRGGPIRWQDYTHNGDGHWNRVRNCRKGFTAIQMREQGGYGLINAIVRCENGAHTDHSNGNNDGHLNAELKCPYGTIIAGFTVRDQGGHGLINLRPYCQSRIAKVVSYDTCMDLKWEVKGDSAGTMSHVVNVQVGTESSQEYTEATRRSIASQATSSVSYGMFSADVSVQAELEKASSSASSQSSSQTETITTTWELDLSKPAYIYQGRIEYQLSDGSWFTQKGITKVTTEKLSKKCVHTTVQ